MSDIAIVGDGIAAMTLALACHQHGLPVQLIACAETTQAADRVVEISANASRVLHALGMRAALAEQAIEPGFAFTRLARSGFQLNQRPLGGFSTARYGAPCYLSSTRNLAQLLDNACHQHNIRRNQVNPAVCIDSKSAEISYSDGATSQHLAIVIADGWRSPLIDAADKAAWPIDEEFSVYHAVCRDVEHDGSIHQWVGRDSTCAEYPLDDGRVDLLLVARDPTGNLQQNTVAATFTEHLQDWHPKLTEKLKTMETACQIASTNSLPADHWHTHKRASIGDACHPLPAYSTQAHGAAIEDAWVLATLMERWDDAPEQSFSDYQRYRRPRVDRLRRQAHAHMKELTLNDPGAIWSRNFRWSMVSRFLPEIAMEQLDWIYGYDCIKGFA